MSIAASSILVLVAALVLEMGREFGVGFVAVGPASARGS